MPTQIITPIITTIFAALRARTPEDRARNKDLRADWWHRRASVLTVRAADALKHGNRLRFARLERRAAKALARRDALRELASRIRNAGF